MDERAEIAMESDGPSCAVDKSCCGGTPEFAALQDGCTLDPSKMPEQLARWQALFGQVLGHNVTDGDAEFVHPSCASSFDERHLSNSERTGSNDTRDPWNQRYGNRDYGVLK